MPAPRLCDIGPDEVLSIRCTCGRVVQFGPNAIQHLGAPPETPIADIVPRLKCENCGARDGFAVTLENAAGVGNRAVAPLPIAVFSEPEPG
jgi:hypothetical protein